jgi:chemotaxis protein methyltransferase CheR
MVLQEFKQGHPGLLNNLTEIIATDISKTILEQAEKGAYDGVSLVRGLSDERKNKYFKPLPDEAKWQVNKEIREIVTFKSFNLMSNFTAFGKFDAIFCRNVLIYFSEDLKKDILSRMIKVLNPGGYLLLGGSESFSGYSDFFDIIRVKSGAIYKLK